MGSVRVVPFAPVLMVTDLKDRLTRTRLAEPAGESWEVGTPASWLRQLVDEWREHDLAGLQRHLQATSHFKVELGGQLVHLLQVPGRGPEPFPLLLTHGWPGSFLEYQRLVPRLTDPAAHGGSAEDAFTVVVPSLPGFGFSSPPPPGGLTAPAVADLWHRLMHEGLGYRRYGAHGSDLGAGVTAWLARLHPAAVAGIHLATPGLPPPPPPWTPAVRAHFDEVQAWTAEEGGYAHQHSTKPATVAAALLDSPTGLAAWIGEKVTAWSATTSDGQPAFPRELLLDTLTLYWATGTVGTSLLPYWAYRHSSTAALPADDPSRVPTTITVFGGERVPFPKPPRELAERYVHLAGWSTYDRGGHFPAVAEPELLASLLRDTFRPLRRR